MNSLRFWGKKRPREQSEAKNRNVQQQEEEASGNISKNQVEKALQAKTAVINLEEYQKLVNAQQTKIVGLEQNHQNLHKLVAALSEKAAKCVESERVEQMKLELKEEMNRKLEELANFEAISVIKLEEYQKLVNVLQTKIVGLEEHQQNLELKEKETNKKLEELGNFEAISVIKLEEYQKLVNVLQTKIVALEEHQQNLELKEKETNKKSEELGNFQAISVIKLEEYQKQVNVLQTKIVALEDHQQNLELKEKETNKKLEELGNFEAISVIKLTEYQKLVNVLQTKIVWLEEHQQILQELHHRERDRVAQLEKDMGRLVDEQNRKLDDLANNAIEKALQAKTADIKLEEYQKPVNALQTKIVGVEEKIEKSIAKMEQQYQNKQKQNTNAFTEVQKGNNEAIVVTELEEQKLSNANKFAELEQQNALQETVVKMEKYQKEQQQNIIDLQKATIDALNENGIGLIMPQQNRWNSSACHRGLALSGPDRLIAQHNGLNSGWRSVLAKRPMPNENFGIFYYEVTIFKDQCNVYIGLGVNQMPLDRCVGWCKGTYAYGSHGHFLGHAVDDGCRGSFNAAHPCIKGQCKFGGGDIVGCGVDLANRQIIYTKNGRCLKTTGLFVDSTSADLFPCVSLLRFGDKIEANFGPKFEYKF
ncbi:hypothetical protein GPALN_007458 [Globodera pallida]|nr:hypothetical protein GPALN_007458 [Globodera pallida]